MGFRINGRKIIIGNRRKFTVSLVLIIILITSIFYFSGKLASNKSKAITYNPKSLVKELPKDEVMDSREKDLNSGELNEDTSVSEIYKPDGHKIAYLTFDDGPSIKTSPEIIKILDKYNVKATFFIVGQMAERYPELVKMEAEDGQAIGNHTFSHNYKYIYSNTDTFIADLKKCDTELKTLTGSSYDGKLIRFPGGSFGTQREPFRKAAKKAGYNYIDWNDLTGDAEGQNIPVTKLIDNLKKNTAGKQHVVILMHDSPTKKTTVDALPEVIEYLRDQGYTFKILK